MGYLSDIHSPSSHKLTQECQLSLLKLLWNRVAIPSQGRLLDIGSGHGFYASHFLKSGYTVTCLDYDVSYRDYLVKQGASFVHCDLNCGSIPLSNASFDLIWCSHVIEHLSEPIGFLDNLNRILAPSGILILRTPDLKSVGFEFWNDPTHVRPFSLSSLHKILAQTSFSVVFLSNCDLPNFRGLHRIRAYKWAPSLLLRGPNLIAVAKRRIVK
jgi:2-polyprenyl-3-methyl-5-hydroxy-6-metoxy-1,4-benzoquinol methylase